MIDSRTIQRITLHVAAVGAIFAGALFLLLGAEAGIGALVGGSVALLNWLALRWILGRVQSGSTTRRSGLMVLLVLKMGILGVVCFALITRWSLHPLGFVIGLASLLVGIVIGATRGAGHPELTGEER